MDAANRALCHALRNPPKGAKETKYKDIKKLVRNVEGGKVSIGAISEAAKTYGTPKERAGRPEGWRKTTKAEDRKLMEIFHKVRPPGYGIDSRRVHKALPKKLQSKVGRRTVINRLAEKGYTATQKLHKSDFKEAQLKKRIAFAKKHEEMSAATWKSELQAVGDIKEFTHYPKEWKKTDIEINNTFLQIHC